MNVAGDGQGSVEREWGWRQGTPVNSQNDRQTDTTENITLYWSQFMFSEHFLKNEHSIDSKECISSLERCEKWNQSSIILLQ